ncbi:avidin/streptavidin family protein [Legionella lytica]|uniref:Avidin/streptavidin family protein n=1 Tax=Legionella lytica TaxID=96232 RepID=A0ABW8D2R3_9GAMM
MSFKTIFYSTIIASSLLSQSINAQENTTVFKNQRGSTLELNLLENNKIEGYFTTAVASKTCPQVINQKRPLIGYVSGNALTFSIVYPMCNSVLSFTGNMSKDKKTIDTLSILNKQAEDIIHEGPGARFIGHDIFEKTA